MMRFYKALLHLYPASFRNEYGTELSAMFARRFRQSSGLALIALWFDAVLEAAGNAAAVHWDIFRQDLRYTARTLWRSPGFAITAILVVALGVGANTAVFSFMDYAFLRALPFPDPDRLVRVWEDIPGYSRMEFSPADYRDLKKAAKSFESLGAFTTYNAVNLSGHGDPLRLSVSQISSDVLPVLGIAPLLGRRFTAEDERPGAPNTALLGYPLWKSQFGGDAAVVGRTILLNDQPYTVIGVLPRDFHFPRREVALWLPLVLPPGLFQDRNDNTLEAVARLKLGVALDAATADANLVMTQLEQQYPKENKNHRATLYRMRDDVSRNSRLLLQTLAGAAICVLLIACTNLANLLLARAMARHKELSVRMALGAGRERLVRQMITESLCLAFAGGVVGVSLAISGLPLLARLAPTSLPISEAPPADFRVLAIGALITLLTGVGFAMIPALRVRGSSELTGLREGSRSGGGHKSRVRSVLVVAEVMVSVVLLVCTGLLLRALWKVQAIDPGFRADGVLTLRTALPFPKYALTERRVHFYRTVLDGVKQIPGVSGAAYTSFLPLAFGGGIWPASVDGKTLDRSENHTAISRYVSPGYFTVMGISLKRGRDVDDSDTLQRPMVAVVSESFAARYWPGRDPIGRHFIFGTNEKMIDRTVVGVVAEVRVRGLEQDSEPQVYMPYRQVDDEWYAFYAPKDLVVRSTLPLSVLAPQLREIIQRADPQQPITGIQPLSAVVEAETASRAVQVRVIAAFAGVAFLLACIGIHGVLSLAVSQRTAEIGVRIALGARAADIVRMIAREGALLAVAGVLPGMAVAYWAGAAMQALLAGVPPADSATFGSAATLSAIMAIAGCLIPALRAVRVDPLTAIVRSS